jgi:hypothetical protein
VQIVLQSNRAVIDATVEGPADMSQMDHSRRFDRTTAASGLRR